MPPEALVKVGVVVIECEVAAYAVSKAA